MRKLNFKIVPDCDLALYEQIKSQIISSLYTGKLREGDALPSIRELASKTNVNQKAVYKIYKQLQEEKYLKIVHGKGVFVRERFEEDFSHLRREALLELIKNTLQKASMLGVNEKRFARLLNRFVTGEVLSPLRCIIIDDKEETEAFSNELKRKLKIDIYPILLDDIERKFTLDNKEIVDFKYVLTTSWHLEQVEPGARSLGKKVLEIKPNPQIYNEIVDLIQTKNVGVIVRDMKTLHASFEVFMNIFYPSTNNKFIITPVNNSELMNEIIRDSEVIFTSPLCWDEVRKITPAGRDLRTFTDFISSEFVDYLRGLQLFEEIDGKN